MCVFFRGIDFKMTTGISFSRLNSLYGNKFETKKDVQEAFDTLFDPLVPKFSDSCARVQLDGSGAVFDRAAIDLEGFARPLWGIVPYVLGGGEFKHWHLYHRGLANGTNPSHPEYWGSITDCDQKQVELAALGFALYFIPEHIWDPLDQEAQKNIGNYLLMGRNHEYPECNWKFFRVLVDMGLNKVGVNGVDDSMTQQYLRDIDNSYIQNGWYRDGYVKDEMLRIDYYNPFAMHFYGLLYASVNPEVAEKYQNRAKEFAQEFIHWFSDDGACIPYGRSLTYRFACGSFWGGLAFSNNEALPWGVIKGLYLRHWRWWAQQPIMRLDEKILTQGYSYPNLLPSESYNSAGSPYWAFKMFITLALPETHPFWTAEEQPLPSQHLQPSLLKVPGMISTHYPQNTIVLVSGPERKGMPTVAEKYNKFAYSTRYGFSVEYDSQRFNNGVFDSMLALSDDNCHFRIRERCITAKVSGNLLYSEWRPWEDVKVETWLKPIATTNWHIRVHRVLSPRKLNTIEGGFCIPRLDFNNTFEKTTGTSAEARTDSDFTGVLDMSGSNKRTARIQKPEGNTNLIHPRTVLPQLTGTIAANEPVVFITAVLANPGNEEIQADWNNPPHPPSVEELETEINTNGELVGIWKYQ